MTNNDPITFRTASAFLAAIADETAVGYSGSNRIWAGWASEEGVIVNCVWHSNGVNLLGKDDYLHMFSDGWVRFVVQRGRFGMECETDQRFGQAQIVAIMRMASYFECDTVAIDTTNAVGDWDSHLLSRRTFGAWLSSRMGV